MLQDQSRNRTPMPGAQAPGAAPPDTGPARAEAGIPAMLSKPEPEFVRASQAALVEALSGNVSAAVRSAIEDHAHALKAGEDEPDHSDEAFDRHSARQNETDERLRSVRCQSLSDLRAKLTYLIPVSRPDLLDQRVGDHLEGLLADVDALSQAQAEPERADTDPIFAAIAEHRTAYAEWDRLSKVWNAMSPDAPGYVEAVAASDAPAQSEGDALEALVTARPTTLAGLLALTEYLPDALRQNDPDAEEPDGERALRSVAQALRQFGRFGLPDAGLAAAYHQRCADADEFLRLMRIDGFVPFPADRPTGLRQIKQAIPDEAGRLLGIAQAEFDRRAEAYASFPTAEREAHLARMRAEYRLDELAAVVRGRGPVPSADAELVVLGQRFDALHALWREAEKANEEPDARRAAAIEKARGLPKHEFNEAERAAWELPGVEEAHDRAQAAFEALEPVCKAIFGTPAEGVAGLAVKARATIAAMWAAGRYEEDASKGDQENWDSLAVRQLIEACCAAAGVDWRGQPRAGAPALPDIAGADAEPADVRIVPEAGLPAVDADPIFALIDARVQAWAAFEAWGKAQGDTWVTDDLRAEENALSDAAQAAYQRMISVAPITTAGRLALLDRLRVELESCGATADEMPERGDPIWSEFFRALRGALGEPMAVATETAPVLFDQIVACWREWAAACGPLETDTDHAAWERVADQRDALLDAVEALPPTLENLPAKALALAWLEFVELWEMGLARGDYDLTGGLAVDIDTAIVGRFRTTDI